MLPPIDLALHPGETWALIGRNGSGKTTLMRTLLGLHPRIAGHIDHAPTLRLGYVPQRGDIDPSLPGRAIDLVRAGLDHGWSFLDPTLPRRHRATVTAALAAVEATALADRPFRTLSEGQKQRILIARALVGDPTVLVLDEPTSAMDPVIEEAIFTLLDRLRRDRDLALIIAGHRLGYVPRFATHALLLDPTQARIELGPAAAVLHSATFRQCFGLPSDVPPAMPPDMPSSIPSDMPPDMPSDMPSPTDLPPPPRRDP